MLKTINDKTVTVKITRHELCDLILACTALNFGTDEKTTKWEKMHDKLKTILQDFDAKFEE